MEAARVHCEGGRADLVITELAPLLLDEDGVAGKGPLSKPKSILEGLQVLQVGLFHMPCMQNSSPTLKVPIYANIAVPLPLEHSSLSTCTLSQLSPMYRMQQLPSRMQAAS